MSALRNVPADVLKAAQAICMEFEPSDTAICVAIMRERERCAKIADARCAHAQNHYKGAVALKLRREIPAAIRTPSQAQLNGEGEGK